MAQSLTLDMAQNCPVADSVIETIVSYQEPEEAGTVCGGEIWFALDDLRESVEAGDDLTRVQRMALYGACRGKWFEDDVRRIIARSKVPSEVRYTEWYANLAVEAEHYEAERDWDLRESHREQAERGAGWKAYVLEEGEDRIRASGYESRLARSRIKRPRQIARDRERRFVLQQRWQD